MADTPTLDAFGIVVADMSKSLAFYRGLGLDIAFLCPSAAAVDATYDRMVGLGSTGHKAPWDAFWGQRYASLLDPDGNGVDLFAPLEP